MLDSLKTWGRWGGEEMHKTIVKEKKEHIINK